METYFAVNLSDLVKSMKIMDWIDALNCPHRSIGDFPKMQTSFRRNGGTWLHRLYKRYYIYIKRTGENLIFFISIIEQLFQQVLIWAGADFWLANFYHNKLIFKNLLTPWNSFSSEQLIQQVFKWTGPDFWLSKLLSYQTQKFSDNLKFIL